jgi:hypothetical protein
VGSSSGPLLHCYFRCLLPDQLLRASSSPLHPTAPADASSGFLQLDDRQNAYDNNDLQGRPTDDGPREGEKGAGNRTPWQRFASMFYSP